MAFEILNEAASVLYVLAGVNRYPQAEPDKVDFDILAQGVDGEGVVSGCAVTPQGVPDTTVAVAAGVVRIGGTDVVYAGGNVNCGAAHAGFPRFDLIAINNAGAASAVAGVAAEPPVFPAVPANSVIVAAVWRAANDNTITAADIVDKRCMLLGASHNLLDGATHLDTVAQAPTRGSLIYSNGTPKWDELPIGPANSVLWTDGVDPSWSVGPRIDRLGIGIAPVAGLELYVNPTVTTGATKTIANISGLITATADNRDYFALKGLINVWPNAGVDLNYIYALDFIAKAWTTATPTTIAVHGAIRALTWHQIFGATASLIETDVYGVFVGCSMEIATAGGVLTLVNRYGILVQAPNVVGGAPTITNCAGLAIEDTTMGTAKNYLVEVGGTLWTLPYFRVIGNWTPAANRTPVYVSEGAVPTLRQLRTMDPGAGGANFAGGELVCILV